MTFLVDQSNLVGKSLTDLLSLMLFDRPKSTPLLGMRPERYIPVREYNNHSDCSEIK